MKKKKQESERWDNILGSRSNRDSKFVKGKGVPGYFKKGLSDGSWSEIARSRLGNGLS